jgi:hypothetical protein
MKWEVGMSWNWKVGMRKLEGPEKLVSGVRCQVSALPPAKQVAGQIEKEL